MANNNYSRPVTSTQIRNFYSDGMAYMNISFFNTNLSFKFQPFISKDNLGRSSYDSKKELITTVNYEGAAALSQVAEDIISGKINECNLPIPCASGASLTIERKLSQNGTMETIFSISKNNTTIPFRFNTIPVKVKENGQIVTKIIECGLKAFQATINGYLSGVNADRHLNKLTDDYVKSIENKDGNNNNQQSGYNNSNGNYGNNNNRYRKNYNNNNGGGKNYNYNSQNQGWNNQGTQQDMSSYSIPN